MLAKQESFLRLRKIGNSNCYECNIKEKNIVKKKTKEKKRGKKIIYSEPDYRSNWTVNMSPFRNQPQGLTIGLSRYYLCS